MVQLFGVVMHQCLLDLLAFCLVVTVLFIGLDLGLVCLFGYLFGLIVLCLLLWVVILAFVLRIGLPGFGFGYYGVFVAFCCLFVCDLLLLVFICLFACDTLTCVALVRGWLLVGYLVVSLWVCWNDVVG